MARLQHWHRIRAIRNPQPPATRKRPACELQLSTFRWPIVSCSSWFFSTASQLQFLLGWRCFRDLGSAFLRSSASYTEIKGSQHQRNLWKAPCRVLQSIYVDLSLVLLATLVASNISRNSSIFPCWAWLKSTANNRCWYCIFAQDNLQKCASCRS